MVVHRFSLSYFPLSGDGIDIFPDFLALHETGLVVYLRSRPRHRIREHADVDSFSDAFSIQGCKERGLS
jgi:hypothetical protein